MKVLFGQYINEIQRREKRGNQFQQQSKGIKGKGIKEAMVACKEVTDKGYSSAPCECKAKLSSSHHLTMKTFIPTYPTANMEQM